jgi:hypothetical protein
MIFGFLSGNTDQGHVRQSPKRGKRRNTNGTQAVRQTLIVILLPI